MDWNKFLTPEAIAAYVIFFLGGIVSLVGFFFTRWLSKAKPKKVILLKESESSLIEIAKQIKDEIVVTYKGKTTASLFLTTFSMWNSGQEVIDNIDVSLDFFDTEVMEVIIEDTIPERIKNTKKVVSNNRIEVSLPYLNPNKEYSDRIKIKVFALEPILIKNINGGGRGWVTETVDRVQLLTDISDGVASVSSIQNISSPTELIFAVLKTYIKLLPTLTKFITRF